MAISQRGSAKNNNSTTASLTVTLSASVGDIIVVLVAHEKTTSGARTVSSISDGTGNTYAKRWSDTQDPDPLSSCAEGFEVWWAYCANALTAATITVTLSGTIDDAVTIAAAYQGFTGTAYQTNPWDSNASLPAHDNQTTTSFPSVTGLSTTSTDGMLLWGYASVDTLFIIDAPSGMTLVQQGINNGAIKSETGFLSEQAYTSAQSSITITGQTHQPRGWMAWGDALTSPAGGATVPQGWQHPIEERKQQTPIIFQPPPAIALTPATLPPRIAGMAWFEPPQFLPKPFEPQQPPPPAFSQVSRRFTAAVINPPDILIPVQFRPHPPPAIALTPATLPPKIAGSAWANIPDVYHRNRSVVPDPPPVPTVKADIVVWACFSADTIFIPDPPKDNPPAMRYTPLVAPVGISGSAWANIPDVYPPIPKVKSDPPAFGQPIVQQVVTLITGWWTIPQIINRVPDPVTYPISYFAQPQLGVAPTGWQVQPQIAQRQIVPIDTIGAFAPTSFARVFGIGWAVIPEPLPKAVIIPQPPIGMVVRPAPTQLVGVPWATIPDSYPKAGLIFQPPIGMAHRPPPAAVGISGMAWFEPPPPAVISKQTVDNSIGSWEPRVIPVVTNKVFEWIIRARRRERR